jgi:hypothetical protein
VRQDAFDPEPFWLGLRWPGDDRRGLPLRNLDPAREPGQAPALDRQSAARLTVAPRDQLSGDLSQAGSPQQVRLAADLDHDVKPGCRPLVQRGESRELRVFDPDPPARPHETLVNEQTQQIDLRRQEYLAGSIYDRLRR